MSLTEAQCSLKAAATDKTEPKRLTSKRINILQLSAERLKRFVTIVLEGMMTKCWTTKMCFDKWKSMLVKKREENQIYCLPSALWPGYKDMGDRNDQKKMDLRESKLKLCEIHVPGQMVRGTT